MSVTWSEVPKSLVEMACGLIRNYHSILLDARIGFVFRSEGSTSGGKIVSAGAQKVDAKMQIAGADYDFLIWIAEDLWIQLVDTQRMALIDHQLCHLDWDGEKGSIRGHDIEEFQEVIERWGLWSRSLFTALPTLQRASQLGFLERGGVVAVDPAENAIAGVMP